MPAVSSCKTARLSCVSDIPLLIKRSRDFDTLEMSAMWMKIDLLPTTNSNGAEPKTLSDKCG